LILLSYFFQSSAKKAFTDVFSFTTQNFSWLYVGSMTFFLLFCLMLLLGPFGKIKLGKDDEAPLYSYTSWMAMLFSAGMGIGLLFYGVAEPVMHLKTASPLFSSMSSNESKAMAITFFHWGFHG